MKSCYFCPNNTIIIAAEHLCICDQCKNDCGTCDLFIDYTQVVQTLNKINRRSNYDENEKNEEYVKAPDFLLPGSVGGLAAANNSVYTLWFVQIKGSLNEQPVYLMTMGTLLPLAKSTC